MIAKPLKPIMELGSKNAFDSRGISYPCIGNFQNTQYIFYTGWSNGKKNPFMNSLGFGVFDGKYKKMGSVSINSDQNKVEEIGSIEIKEFNDSHFMFFTEFHEWKNSSPKYNIRAAKNTAINEWDADQSFNFEEIDAVSSMICRPSIIKHQSKYLMFFCHREKDTDYQIGLARSDNFFNWNLHSTNIFENILLEDWCNQGQAYPHVYKDLKTENCYLFFAGNSYGRDGFGVLQFTMDSLVQ